MVYLFNIYIYRKHICKITGRNTSIEKEFDVKEIQDLELPNI